MERAVEWVEETRSFSVSKIVKLDVLEHALSDHGHLGDDDEDDGDSDDHLWEHGKCDESFSVVRGCGVDVQVAETIHQCCRKNNLTESVENLWKATVHGRLLITLSRRSQSRRLLYSSPLISSFEGWFWR